MHKFEITNAEGGAAFPVLITPKAAVNRLIGKEKDAICVELAAPPTSLAIDQALIAFLSELLAIGAERIAIASGKSVEKKVVIVMGVMPEEIETRLFG